MRKFVIIILFLTFCSGAMSLAAERPQPVQFEVYYGNGLFGFNTIKLKAGKVIYKKHRPPHPAQSEVINPSQKKWAAFRETLDKLNVWNWKGDYQNSNVMDGTQWNIKISYADKSVVSQGSNAYPLADATSNNSPEPSNEFKLFLKALKDLTGKEYN